MSFYLNHMVLFAHSVLYNRIQSDFSISGQIKCFSSQMNVLKGVSTFGTLKMRMRSIRLSKQISPRTFFVYFSHRKNEGKVNSNQTDAYLSLSDVQRFPTMQSAK